MISYQRNYIGAAKGYNPMQPVLEILLQALIFTDKRYVPQGSKPAATDDIVEKGQVLESKVAETPVQETKAEKKSLALEWILSPIYFRPLPVPVIRKKPEKLFYKSIFMDKFENWGGSIYYRTRANRLRYCTTLRRITV